MIRRNLSRFKSAFAGDVLTHGIPFLKRVQSHAVWGALSTQAIIFAVEADVGLGLGLTWGCP